MSLKHILMNIITFGFYSLKLLYSKREEEIAQAKSITHQATKLKESFEATPRRMTMIQPYNTLDPDYMRKIYESFNDPAVKFFLFNIQQDIFNLSTTATDNKSVEIMGMSKGIAYLLKSIEANTVNYKTPQKEQPDNTEDGDYV